MYLEDDSARVRVEVDMFGWPDDNSQATLQQQVGVAWKHARYCERLAVAALITLQAHSETAYDELIERAKEWK